MAVAKPKAAKKAKPKRPKAPPPTADRVEFGLRLKGARAKAELTQAHVAAQFSINKATVSAWESGRGLPDALVFRSLVKLYKTTADAMLLGSATISFEAKEFAAKYENLSSTKKALLTIIWKSIIEDGVPDEQVLKAFNETSAKNAAG
jgi:transcriptional regulator with XRE-family HTH domain